MERISFELSELKAFVAAAEYLSFKAAADSLDISQPALSRRIDKLESSVGFRLFERTTRHVALTEAGERFIDHARTALQELESGLLEIDAHIARICGQITIACIPSLANSFLPVVLQHFVETYPEIRIRIIDEGAWQVLESVRSGGADLGLNFIGAQEADIDFQPFYTEEYCLAVHHSHPLGQHAAIDWSRVADERLISVAKTSGNRILIDNALAHLPKRPRTFYETRHITGALSLVSQGLGVAAVPALSIPRNGLPDIRCVALQNPVVTRVLGLITKRDKPLQPAALALHQQLLEAANTLLLNKGEN